MSTTAQTLGILVIALVGLIVYLSAYVLGAHFLFYLGLGLAPTFLILILVLTTGRMEEN
ncbi:MAG: hypothetical protein HQL37_03745 [Alphaproteobacteria bacterium]|nr:hypothetical protein [Alphaproteobacteria bacterium]